MFLTFQWRVTDWQVGSKNKFNLCVVFKRLTSSGKTYTDWKWKWYSKQGEPEEQGKIVILISDEVDFKPKLEKIKEVIAFW